MVPSTSSYYSLGIDIGTTKVAVALVSADSREVVTTASLPHDSDVDGLPLGRSEQVVSKIFACLDACIELLPLEYRQAIGCIGVTGQMHGVVLWNERTQEKSHLVTWQDQRCLEGEFLSRLRESTGDVTAQSGYGNATLAWFAAHEPETIRKYSAAGTIHDYVVAIISGNYRPCTDPSDAASFGFFDLKTRQWREDCIEKAGIPRSLLPEIRKAGEKVGVLSVHFADRWGMPGGVAIANALGDNQASLYGSLTDPSQQIALTIGTGAQLSVVVSELPLARSTEQGKFEFRPYIGDSYIAVVASLSGGRVLAGLARALAEFMKEAGVDPLPSVEAIHHVMHVQGLKKIATDLSANASLSGERHDTSLRGSLTNLSFDNLSIGDITAALCRGLVASLRDSLPQQLLAGRREVVGSGNAICRSPLMQQIIQQSFGCTLKLQEGAESTASGAALLAASEK